MSAALKIENLHAGYGKLPILNGVNLSVEAESITALIGPNGAGKSTVLKAVFGLTGWRKGRISFEGEELSRLPTHEIIRHGVCFVHQGRNIFPTLSVQENLELGAYIRANEASLVSDLERVYELFPALKKKRLDTAKSLSGGQQQMLGLGRALMLHPKMLLLDEPSLGLAPKILREIFEKIGYINELGTTILLVEQNVQEALEDSDKVFILREGRVEFEGTPKEVLASDVLKKAYLGR